MILFLNLVRVKLKYALLGESNNAVNDGSDLSLQLRVDLSAYGAFSI